MENSQRKLNGERLILINYLRVNGRTWVKEMEEDVKRES